MTKKKKLGDCTHQDTVLVDELKEVDDFTKLDRRPKCRSDKGEIALIIFSYVFTFVLGMVAMGEIIYASVTL